jgi:hypothetical protein
MMPMQNRVPYTFFAFIAVLGAPLAPSTAWAQRPAGAGETIPVRIKLGALRPSGQITRNLSGSQVPGGLIDLAGSHAADARTLTVGYFQGSTNGKSFRTVPLLVTKDSASSSSVQSLTGFYTSEGLGAYFIDAANSGFKMRLGGYVGAGLRLSGGLLVEAQYHYVNGSVNGASPNGIAIFIGRRN